jgi:hypothetical protein
MRRHRKQVNLCAACESLTRRCVNMHCCDVARIRSHAHSAHCCAHRHAPTTTPALQQQPWLQQSSFGSSFGLGSSIGSCRRLGFSSSLSFILGLPLGSSVGLSGSCSIKSGKLYQRRCWLLDLLKSAVRLRRQPPAKQHSNSSIASAAPAGAAAAAEVPAAGGSMFTARPPRVGQQHAAVRRPKAAASSQPPTPSSAQPIKAVAAMHVSSPTSPVGFHSSNCRADHACWCTCSAQLGCCRDFERCGS